PEDLGFLPAQSTGVAYLAASVWMEQDKVRAEPRRHSLRVPDGAFLTSVIRVESRKPALSAEQLNQVEKEIVQWGVTPRASALQIDFDALASERVFYRQLLERLRPKVKKLSITALASWCLDDGWIRDLPIDEAVPMLFRMASDDAVSRRYLAAGR